MVLKDENPDSVKNGSETCASVSTTISRFLERHFECFSTIKRDRESSAGFVNNFNVLGVEFRSSMHVNFLVFHQVFTEVDLLTFFIFT